MELSTLPDLGPLWLTLRLAASATPARKVSPNWASVSRSIPGACEAQTTIVFPCVIAFLSVLLTTVLVAILTTASPWCHSLTVHR